MRGPLWACAWRGHSSRTLGSPLGLNACSTLQGLGLLLGTRSDASAAPEPVFTSRTQTVTLKRTVCSQVNARKNEP